VKCHLDGELVHDLDIASPKQVPTMYACASKEKASGDIIVKVVNAATIPIETTLNFSGESSAPKQGMAMVLTSASGMDENSLAEPTKVSPKSEPISWQGSTLKREFPANSFTVLRFKTTR
jgi:alpha-L-arabinofuranosidase